MIELKNAPAGVGKPFQGFPLGITISRMPLDAIQARKRAKQLITHAVDDAVSVEEARSFAMRAVKLIHKHGLLDAESEGGWRGVVDDVLDGGVVEEAVAGAVGDLIMRGLKRSGIGNSLKRAAAAASRRGSRRRR